MPWAMSVLSLSSIRDRFSVGAEQRISNLPSDGLGVSNRDRPEWWCWYGVLLMPVVVGGVSLGHGHCDFEWAELDLEGFRSLLLYWKGEFGMAPQWAAWRQEGPDRFVAHQDHTVDIRMSRREGGLGRPDL